MTKKAIVTQLFEGLKPVQKQMFLAFFAANGGRKYVFHCARRLGKTHLLCVISACMAINKPNAQIRYATFTQKALKKMVLPIFKQLFGEMPTKFRPTFNVQDGSYKFPNGSQIHLSGVNNGHSDDLRGTSSDLCLIDEAGFIDELTYLVESVLMPQLLTVPNAKLIMASSSPLSPAHEFVDYINQAKLDDLYHSFDIYSGGYKPELLQEFCKEAGGSNSTTWRREYRNEVIVDEVLAVIPEWGTKGPTKVVHSQFYNFYHRYCSADWGVRDKTAVLWGYYDFQRAKLVIEAEYTCSGPDSTTRSIANAIKATEAKLGYTKIHRRPADNNELILLQDLAGEFNLHFFPTTKDTLAAMVNEARLWVQNNRLEVSENCPELLACLQFAVFNNDKRSEFGRSKALGHYDALASLIYMIRNIDQHTNPIPHNYGYTENIFDPNVWEDPASKTVKQIFNIRN